jgi:hypothetical protein
LNKSPEQKKRKNNQTQHCAKQDGDRCSFDFNKEKSKYKKNNNTIRNNNNSMIIEIVELEEGTKQQQQQHR